MEKSWNFVCPKKWEPWVISPHELNQQDHLINRIALDVLVSAKCPPHEVTFVVSGVLQQGSFWLIWMQGFH